MDSEWVSRKCERAEERFCAAVELHLPPRKRCRGDKACVGHRGPFWPSIVSWSKLSTICTDVVTTLALHPSQHCINKTKPYTKDHDGWHIENFLNWRLQ